jgi:hypothetical protein
VQSAAKHRDPAPARPRPWLRVDRHTDAKRLDEIANDPAIYPWIQGPHRGPFRLHRLAADPNNVVLIGRHGAVWFQRHQPALYEQHTMVLPEGRGPWARHAMWAAFHWMFTRTDALEIVTKVPVDNLAALTAARMLGYELEFTLPDAWPTDRGRVAENIYSYSAWRWVRSDKRLVEIGRWFHDMLAHEYRRLGRAPELHPDNLDHDRYVGAAIEMMAGGQVQKGYAFYNRWAAIAGAPKIRVLELNPLTIDIRDARLRVTGETFEVV